MPLINIKYQRIMKSLFKFTLLTILLTITSSCSSQEKLSKEEAMNILKENFKEPCTKRFLFSFNSVDKNYDEYLSDAYLAQDEGMVTVSKKFISGIGGGGRYEIRLQPSQLMKSDFFKGGNQYKVADGYVVAILGISQDNNSNKAMVRFSYKFQPNQIYKLRGRVNGKREECPTQTYEEVAEFTLYDTGWQLDN